MPTAGKNEVHQVRSNPLSRCSSLTGVNGPAMANSSSQMSGSLPIKDQFASVIKAFQEQVINETIRYVFRYQPVLQVSICLPA